MSCQRNKNTQEKGVHLTERTCSPYNPIIRLMVDDCLGLPIYPVSSIDAIINEEGNTLRNILEDLLDQAQNGSSTTKLIEKINEALDTLDDKYTDLTQDFEGLKNWLLLISSIGDESPNENTERTNPSIVAAIKELLDDIASILETIGLTDDSQSDENILEKIRNLEALAQEIGKCGEENLRVNAGGATWIVHYVTDLLNRVHNLEDKAGENHRLAHLEDEPLNKLLGEEYPITSAMFITDSAIDFPKFYDTLFNLKTGESAYAWFKPNIVAGIGIDPDKDYDYNNNGVVDFGDVDTLNKLRTNQISINSIKPGTTTDVNNDEDVGLGDVTALTDIIISGASNNSNQVWYTADEDSLYILEFTKVNNNDYVVPSNIADIFQVLTGYNVTKHPLIEGKIYSNTLNNATYVFLKKSRTGSSNYGNMVRLHKVESDSPYLEVYEEDKATKLALNLVSDSRSIKFTEVLNSESPNKSNLSLDISPVIVKPSYITEVGDYFIENGSGVYLRALNTDITTEFNDDDVERKDQGICYKYEVLRNYTIGKITDVTNTLKDFLQDSDSSVFINVRNSLKDTIKRKGVDLYNEISGLTPAEGHELDKSDILDLIASLLDIHVEEGTASLSLSTNNDDYLTRYLTYLHNHPNIFLLQLLNDTNTQDRKYKFFKMYDYSLDPEYSDDPEDILLLIKKPIPSPTDSKCLYYEVTLTPDELLAHKGLLRDINGDGLYTITDLTNIIRAALTELPLVRHPIELDLSSTLYIVKRGQTEEERVTEKVTSLPIGTHVFDVENKLEYIIIDNNGNLLIYPRLSIESYVVGSELLINFLMGDLHISSSKIPLEDLNLTE